VGRGITLALTSVPPLLLSVQVPGDVLWARRGHQDSETGAAQRHAAAGVCSGGLHHEVQYSTPLPHYTVLYSNVQ